MLKIIPHILLLLHRVEKYTLFAPSGDPPHIEDFDGCIQKRDEIVEIVSGMFPNAYKDQGISKISSDPSGKSIVDQVDFLNDSGSIYLSYCDNFQDTYRLKL